METARTLHHFLRLLSLPLLLLFHLHRAAPRRLLSFVAIKELLLYALFLRHGLVPTTVPIPSLSASLHLWTPSSRRRPQQQKQRDPKPALLLIHGFGGNSKWQWERQIGPLSRAFDVYVPDLLFFGRSHSGGVGDRSIAFQARCVAEAMRRLGVERYAVVGISYGGFVAYRLAVEEAAAEVERAVVLTAGVCATPEQRMEMVAREERDVAEILIPQKAEDLMELIRRSMYRPPKWIPAFLLDDFIEIMYKNQRKERQELLKELLEKGIGIDPLPVLKQDTLLLWGDKDNVFPLPLAHQLERHLGEKSRLVVIEDAGHALQLEKYNEVNQLILKFLVGGK